MIIKDRLQKALIEKETETVSFIGVLKSKRDNTGKIICNSTSKDFEVLVEAHRIPQ